MKSNLANFGALALVAPLMLGPVEAEEIRIAHIADRTGLMEPYAIQSYEGFMLGLEYATGGTMAVGNDTITVIPKDSALDPAKARALLAEAYGDDDVALAVGGTSSSVAKAMLPIAEEFEKILIVEPAVADGITGEWWNRYIFRTSRNSSQDAVSSAVAIGGEGVKVATLAQDYAVGRDGIEAFREAIEATGAELVHEEFVAPDATDFTAPAERVFTALKDLDGEKKLFVLWAGTNNPIERILALEPSRFGIELTSTGNILAAMATYKSLPGMEGATYYYYEIPQNEVNDWLVETHFERFGTPPDFFTAGGMAAGIAVVKALEAAGGTDTESLISALEGMEWQTPKGTMRFRPEDHQALQSMYHFRIRVEDDVTWAIPDLVQELTIDDLQVPIRN